MKYKVKWLKDESYEVVKIENEEVMYQGSLSDCEAWIRLTEKGYM